MSTRQTMAALAMVWSISACARERASVPQTCMSPDSIATPRPLAFSKLRVSEVTGDLSGFKFSFSTGPQEWGGEMWWAEGALGKPDTLSAVRFDSASRALTFTRVDRADTGRFEGWFTCDSVWGLFVPFPADTYQLTLLRDTMRF